MSLQVVPWREGGGWMFWVSTCAARALCNAFAVSTPEGPDYNHQPRRQMAGKESKPIGYNTCVNTPPSTAIRV